MLLRLLFAVESERNPLTLMRLFAYSDATSLNEAVMHGVTMVSTSKPEIGNSVKLTILLAVEQEPNYQVSLLNHDQVEPKRAAVTGPFASPDATATNTGLTFCDRIVSTNFRHLRCLYNIVTLLQNASEACSSNTILKRTADLPLRLPSPANLSTRRHSKRSSSLYR